MKTEKLLRLETENATMNECGIVRWFYLHSFKRSEFMTYFRVKILKGFNIHQWMLEMVISWGDFAMRISLAYIFGLFRCRKMTPYYNMTLMESIENIFCLLQHIKWPFVLRSAKPVTMPYKKYVSKWFCLFFFFLTLFNLISRSWNLSVQHHHHYRRITWMFAFLDWYSFLHVQNKGENRCCLSLQTIPWIDPSWRLKFHWMFQTFLLPSYMRCEASLRVNAIRNRPGNNLIYKLQAE